MLQIIIIVPNCPFYRYRIWFARRFSNQFNFVPSLNFATKNMKKQKKNVVNWISHPKCKPIMFFHWNESSSKTLSQRDEAKLTVIVRWHCFTSPRVSGQLYLHNNRGSRNRLRDAFSCRSSVCMLVRSVGVHNRSLMTVAWEIAK